MKGIFHYLKEKEDIQTIVAGTKEGFSEQLVAGLSGTARSLFIASIKDTIHQPLLIITHQLLHAQQLYEDLTMLLDDRDVYLYPVNESITSEIVIASPELRAERIKALSNWRKQKNGILIAPVAALKRVLPPPVYWDKYELAFTIGENIAVESYLRDLVEMGYERVQMVTSPAQFSIRGGIIDIYPVTALYPIRIELFDDEVDSIRYFDAESQRSLDTIEHATIGPAKELLLTEKDMTRAANRLEESLRTALRSMSDKAAKEQLLTLVEHDIQQLKQLTPFQDMYKYSSLFYEQAYSLLDYVPNEGIIIFDEMSRIEETAQSLEVEEVEIYKSLFEQKKLINQMKFSYEWAHIKENMTQQKIYMSVFLRHIPNTSPENIVNMSSRPMQQFHGQMPLLKNELSRWEKVNFSVVIAVENDERAKKVQSILRDYQMDASISRNIQLPMEKPTVVVANIPSGVEFPLHKLAIITENELFKTRQQRVAKSKTMTNAERIKSYQELAVGDYIVHRDHGIGKYLGIETLQVKDLHKDYLLIHYSGNDKLYVPIDQMDLIQKYVGSEGKEPRLYKLGGTEWQRVKRRVQSSVEDIADELIKLYAARQAQKGHAFLKDTSMQDEFELAFPYEETKDQLQSVEEIKHDMEKAQPMDRLLCGDVGYGKTEVALRAAFKAITEGKQVAFLVPTTILAQQHYQTMQERFQDFAVNIGLLSRFRTAKQQQTTIQRLKEGKVDIVIGTHRLLSKDVAYRDLGLLIVDEEQRFGVKHKERIKQIKTNVDVLTLTATPIPRTLHMSMLGIRDLSVIETPPENRFPVQTYVIEHNPIFIREAIERELARGGQVFLLYNRINRINKVAQDIAKLVPDANVSVAHGRMNESQLENTMLSFLEGESDVLVSTTIIETGVDIPNVNTLIVYDADHMGLSQLYQLRGRVGRSNRIAYAYFTYRQDKVLTEVAEKRLQAIKEFTELGSGFKIAMRDLSIRGAGNLLGAEQHGFIDSVGFDLYSQMLKEAIDARKEGKDATATAPFNPELAVDIDAYIPDAYIKDEQQKIAMYKRFSTLNSQEDRDDLIDELIDRFGDFPHEVDNLLTVSYLNMLAKQERVESIIDKGKRTELLVEAERSQRVDGSKLFTLANEYGRTIQLGTANEQLKVTFNWQRESIQDKYDIVSSFIEQLAIVNQA